MRDYAAEADRIIREGAERRAQVERDRVERLFRAVQAGEAITVFGRRYVPES